MIAGQPFKIISVTGSRSGAGKTTLCSILLREFKGFGAIKFTKTPLYVSVVDDVNILSRKGKDTAHFLEAGAVRVLWIKSPYNGLGDVLDVAVGRMSDLNGVVIEGNSPVDFLNPHLVVFIIDCGGEIKPSALKVVDRADIVIINSSKQDLKRNFQVPKGLPGSTAFWIDLTRRKGEIDEFLCFVKKRIDERGH